MPASSPAPGPDPAPEGRRRPEARPRRGDAQLGDTPEVARRRAEERAEARAAALARAPRSRSAPLAPLGDLLGSLNPEQRAAVLATEGAVLVLAGAGSGKTRVVTFRIAHLLAKGVAPEAVLAMTFTNKAAAERRERVGALVGPERAAALTIGTFHAFCLHLLREHAAAIGFPKGFTICDHADQVATAKSVLRELRVAETSIQPGALQARISLLKNQLQTPALFLQRAACDEDELVGRAWERYDAALARSRRLDFDDLLTRSLQLLREHAVVREAVRERFRYVMVDEYQDTNAPQYEIVRQIVGGHGNLCVVGDDDQSIYGWRGADVRKILSFERDFPAAQVVKLETNYRSTVEILNAANRVIRNNPGRHEKTLRSAVGNGEQLQAVCVQDESAEAEHVVNELLNLVRRGKARLGDFAILFRTAVQPRPFEAELRAKGVPYVLVGGMSFFDRKEVRDVIAYLRLIANPRDEASLLRIVNCPPRGVGKTTIDRVLQFATEHGIGACEAFERGHEIDGVNAAAIDAVQRLRARLEALGEMFQGHQLVALIRRLLEEVAYEGEVARCYPDARAREQRWQAVVELLNTAENHVNRRKKPSLAHFLNELTLEANDSEDAESAAQRDVVTLMTLHASKGLEFPRVYLVGLEEGLLPHGRAVAEDTVEEERRLCYVGITRARQALTLSYTRERAKYGTRVMSHPSRFLFEIKGEAPPEDWIPAGTPAPERERVKKEAARKARRKAGGGRKKAARKKAARRGRG